ncbi:hypothetical protein KSS87_021385 [Heliosperma pusillum]|nr:hypothetical protein KSS87_021385 [Heliosperma pusillum]
MKFPKKDPEKEQCVDMLLCMNYMEKFVDNFSQFYRIRGQTKTTWLPSKYEQLGSRRKLLSEFLSKRQKEKEELLELKKQRQKEKEELRELKKQRQKEKEELRDLKKQKRELMKIKREKKELKKIKREKKELRRMKREKKELKKKKRAETTVNDGDEAPSKKLKLVEVQDDHANDKEMLNLEVLSSEDVDQQRQCVPPCEPVGNLMAEGLKLCTRQAEKKNENLDHSKDE